jgi:phosphoribosylaminoimidazole-succinocarboxamide synthase
VNVADVLNAQADTKFEFGLDEETDEIYLVDEVLTCVTLAGIPEQ